jgi:hypothetical protein
MSMADDWFKIFDEYSTKTVSKTDKEKGAYVVNSQQKSVIYRAGILPTDSQTDRLLNFGVLGDENSQLSVSYYNSLRIGAGRTPETRMGREIVAWVQIGDLLTIGRIGNQLFFVKETGLTSEPAAENLGRQLAKLVDPAKIMARAKQRVGPPPKRARMINDFVRDFYIVAAALLRADGSCEMPNCTSALFERDDDRPYLEVHHVMPLGEGGDDTLINAAALCPSCHRELHYGKRRLQKRETLRKAIEAKATP